MTLHTRSLPFEVPSYSLTGDILSYQRCGLQYRYYNGSSLPPSRPVQIWVGEFVHGVMEEAYRLWRVQPPPFPWPCHPTPWPIPDQPLVRDPHDIGVLGDRVEARLAAKGTRPRSQVARDSAYARVEAAVNLLGPHLFSLITAAEERISGTRTMPALPVAGRARGDRYELTGIVDVISSVQVSRDAQNPIVEVIHNAIPPLSNSYDLIVDYKSMRRPSSSDPNDQTWQHHAWQVQTYSWLRAQASTAPRVGAGLILYINELAPTKTDLEALRDEIRGGRADIAPANGSADYYALETWQRGGPLPALTFGFKLRRAIRVVDVAAPVVDTALGQIDDVVSAIEGSALQEFNSGVIPQNWTACGKEQDCVACDFKHFCPSPAPRRPGPRTPAPPRAPG